MPGAEIYVSYAWSDDTPEGRDRAAVVDNLCAKAARRNIRILRDKDVLGLGERISEFMRRIGAADRVFVILSDKYLKSPACMFELCEIWRNSRQDDKDFLSRIRVYTLPCAKIWTALDRSDYAIHWKQRHDALEARVREHGYNILGRQDMEDLRLMDTFRQSVGDILVTVADVLQPRSFDDLFRYGLNDILSARPQPHNGSGPEAHKHTGPRGAPASAVDETAGGGPAQGARSVRKGSGMPGDRPVYSALVVTALPVEFAAVCAFLADRTERVLRRGAVCELGSFEGSAASWRVTVMETGPGNENAAVEASIAVSEVEPDVAIFVGIAGGIKDVKIGDVVAATKIYKGFRGGFCSLVR